jgi:hypothetical protein
VQEHLHHHHHLQRLLLLLLFGQHLHFLDSKSDWLEKWISQIMFYFRWFSSKSDAFTFFFFDGCRWFIWSIFIAFFFRTCLIISWLLLFLLLT